jgi:hypothetical protein
MTPIAATAAATATQTGVRRHRPHPRRPDEAKAAKLGTEPKARTKITNGRAARSRAPTDEYPGATFQFWNGDAQANGGREHENIPDDGHPIPERGSLRNNDRTFTAHDATTQPQLSISTRPWSARRGVGTGSNRPAAQPIQSPPEAPCQATATLVDAGASGGLAYHHGALA